MSMSVKKSNSYLRFDVFSDDEFQCSVTQGLLVEDCGDDVKVYIGQGNMMTIIKTIDALVNFAFRTGHGRELIEFLKEKGNEND